MAPLFNSPYNRVRSGRPWISGFLPQLPWPGLSALFGALLCAIAAAAVLILSNGKPTSSWPKEGLTVQPAVLLALFTAITNALLRFALQEGCTVAWWVQVLKGGNLSDLHRYWTYGVSFKEAACSGRYFNKIAAACLLMTFVAIDGLLLQRASTVTTNLVTRPITMSVSVSPQPLPRGFSGVSMTRAPGIDLVVQPFTDVLQTYVNRSTIALEYSECGGTCSTTFAAAGFDVRCSNTAIPYKLVGTGGSLEQIGYANVNFNGKENSGGIEVQTAYKADPSCEGNLVGTTCQLQIAKVNYPVTIVNGTVRLPSRSALMNDTIEVQYPYLETTGLGVWPSTLGGIALAAQNLYGSNLTSYFTGVFAVTSTGPMASAYLNSSRETYGTCATTWNDPTPDILAAIRELVFRSAIFVSNSSTKQDVAATDTLSQTVYLSHPSYLVGAMFVMILNILVILPLFLGWWQLGRTVSLSPIETAKAFRAPLLSGGDCNSDADGLVKELGYRRARYGVVSGSARQIPPDVDSWSSGAPKHLGQSSVIELTGMDQSFGQSAHRLQIADPRLVSKPIKGAIYSEPQQVL